MVTLTKVLMRIAALIVGTIVMVAVRIALPNLNFMEACLAFWVCWLCFSFGLVLLGGSYLVGRGKDGMLTFAGKSEPTAAELMRAHADKRLCILSTCDKPALANSLYCGDHRLKCSPAAGGK